MSQELKNRVEGGGDRIGWQDQVNEDVGLVELRSPLEFGRNGHWVQEFVIFFGHRLVEDYFFNSMKNIFCPVNTFVY